MGAKAATKNTSQLSESELQDLVIESDSGARKPGGITAMILLIVALLWSLFQVWISSPLPYTDFFAGTLNIHVLNGNESRFIHLSFAIFLAFMAYPATKNSPRAYVPIVDWIFAILAVSSAMYLFIFREELARRSGIPTDYDIICAAVGILLLLEAARRALGPPLVIISVVFLLYTFFGNSDFIPEMIQHKGQSIEKIASHQWLGDQGVFGIAIGVSTSFVFMFVLFGALLDKAGAGNYFIKVAFSLLGHLRGGPAKAAVLSSAMTGLISGSSIANVVTTGTFTVPLMRKVGFTREKAGAIEVASSVNGQIMPPVMGAAAFLMVDFVGITYTEVVKHAFIPAIISYIALLYMVHLEALKTGMKALEKPVQRTAKQSLLLTGIVLSSVLIICSAIYYSIEFIKHFAGDISVLGMPSAAFFSSLLLITGYVGLLKFSSGYPPLQIDDPNSKVTRLPETGPTVKTGLHYILPIVVLVWCLMIERLSPSSSAFWAAAFMMFIVVTQKPILAFFRGEKSLNIPFKNGLIDLLDGMVTGARNMIGIGIATATAGIIVGTVSLTGIGQVMTEVVETISGGSFFLVLVFTAIICLILGMGLPTTANYIVVSSLMAVVIEELGRQNGIIVPLIAIHLFVFYFGIMADVTPPVGLASFAAAAVSGGDPIRTGVQAFIYSIRTVILPFIFIYNTDLLLVGVDSWSVGIAIFLKATFAILLFAAALQGYFIVRNKLHESIMLLLIAFSLFNPGIWINMITPAYEVEEPRRIFEVMESVEAGSTVKIEVAGFDAIGDEKDFFVFMEVPEGDTGAERLKNYGIILNPDSKRVMIENTVFASDAERDGLDFDFEILSLHVPQPQLSDWWVYGASMLVFGGLIMMQRSRRINIIAEPVAKKPTLSSPASQNKSKTTSKKKSTAKKSSEPKTTGAS